MITQVQPRRRILSSICCSTSASSAAVASSSTNIAGSPTSSGNFETLALAAAKIEAAFADPVIENTGPQRNLVEDRGVLQGAREPRLPDTVVPQVNIVADRAGE